MKNSNNTDPSSINMNDELGKLKFPQKIQRDTIVTAKVTSVNESMITVDVGFRAEGLIIGSEMYVEGERELPKVGDDVSAYVINDGAYLGSPRLSIKKTSAHKKWNDLEDAVKTGATMKATVTDVNTGGVMVQLPAQIKGFIPASHLDQSRLTAINTGDNVDTKVSAQLLTILQPMIGQEVTVKVLEVDKKKGRVLLSEKNVNLADLEDKHSIINDQLKLELLSRIKIGDILDATVTGIAPFGIFVIANGVEGLVHNSQISWDRSIDRKLKVGDTVKCKVMLIDDKTKRVAYSIKLVEEDPWNNVMDKHRIGEVVDAEVTKITEYGAFVKLTDGLSGLVHNSEVDNNSNVRASDKLKEGTVYPMKIVSISPEDRHIALTLRGVN